jgi:hypothetical protein
MPEPFRFVPKMPPSAYKTYALRLPKETHYRKATCQEVLCEAYMNGWVTHIDVSTNLGQRQAKYIVDKSGRTFTETTSIDTSHLREFRFPQGQQCFADHQVPLEREPLYIVRGGDWRGNPRGEHRVHVRASDWIEDFAEHQAGIIAEIEKG